MKPAPRAFCIASLEDAALSGHTLLPKAHIVDAITNRPVRPACAVTGDTISARARRLELNVRTVDLEDGIALQLDRYAAIGELARKQIEGRVGGQRHVVDCDWERLLREKFGAVTDADEEVARQEKSAALKELAEARLSVLSGPAGAGKTTVLGILCSRPEIKAEGLLLLAPTGKARVRMQELAASRVRKH